MASSKVMSSTSPVNQDLPRQSAMHPADVTGLQNDQSKSFGSMNMDELLKNICGDTDAFSALAADNGACVGIPADTGGDGSGVSFSGQENVGNKTVDEVWKEIVTGNEEERCDPELTLEDFLTKAGAVIEEEVEIGGFSAESMANATQFEDPPHMHSSHTGPVGFGVDSVGLGNGMGSIVAVGSGGGGGVGRAKRRAVEEPQLDSATLQKQRRMIKNRESAARSRERKQAYTIELEALVTQLEEENARLLNEEAELNQERFEQLMENLVPVAEKRRPAPRRVLRRVQSM